MNQPTLLAATKRFHPSAWLWLLLVILSAGSRVRADDIYGSGDFILNDGPVFSDTGTFIGSTSVFASSDGSAAISWLPHSYPDGFENSIPTPTEKPLFINVSAAHGTVTKTPDQASYSYGATVSLSAVPDPGYVFTGWTGRNIYCVFFTAESIAADGTTQTTDYGRWIAEGYKTNSNATIKIKTYADTRLTANFEPVSRIVSLEGTLSWPRLTAGQTAVSQFTIRNQGNSPLNVTGINYPEGFCGAWSGEIEPGHSQEILLTFAPTRVGTFTGNVVVQSDATAGTSSLPVSALAENVYTLSGKSTFTELGENVSQVTLAIERNYWAGSLVHAVASPVTGYQFVNWTEGNQVVSTEASFYLTITGARRLMAHYASNTAILEAPAVSNFGEKQLKSVSCHYLKFHNTGNIAVYVCGWKVAGSLKEQASFQANWKGWIQPGASQRVPVRFKPLRKQRYAASIAPLTTDWKARVSAVRISGAGR